MPQAGITIPNGTGKEVLDRIRAALESLACDFYGPTDPATIYGISTKMNPGFRWADSNAKILKIRNLTNDGWISFMDLNTGDVLTSANKLDGYHADTGTTANTVPVRDANGKLPGDITGNAATANIADEAKGDTRFQISGSVGEMYSVEGESTYDIHFLTINLPPYTSLVLKRARWWFTTSYLRLWVDGIPSGGNRWESSSYRDDIALNFTLITNNSAENDEVFLAIRAYNTSTLAQPTQRWDGWWLDLAIE